MENYQKRETEASRDLLTKKVVTGLQHLEPLRLKATEALIYKNFEQLKSVVVDLLKACFGEDVSSENIQKRLDEQIDILERYISEASGPPQPGKDPVVEYNCLFAQRILAASLGLFTKRLESEWLNCWPENSTCFNQIMNLHDLILKYLLFSNTIPAIVSLRSIQPHFISEYDSGASLEHVLLDPDAARATITFDLLQPKENLLTAFEAFIDKAKKQIKATPENNLLANLYDFTRNKPGHRERPLYDVWHKAIIDFEAFIDYDSLYIAAQDLAPCKKDGKHGVDSTRKNLENSRKRFDSLLNAVMNNTFPSLD